MYMIADIMEALHAEPPRWRTLRGVKIMSRNFVAGNYAVVVQGEIGGELMTIKCYVRPRQHLAEIYGKHHYPSELLAYNILCKKRYIDCVIYPYIEGRTLDKVLLDEECNPGAIADAFEEMARWLLGKPYAHGDIKPENIILLPNGKLRLIDWDSAYVPKLEGEESQEVGTSAYQHPKRKYRHYGKFIDDYSIAYLLTMLRAAQYDPQMMADFRVEYTFIPTPRQIVQQKAQAVKHIAALFAERYMAKEYALSQLLYAPHPALPSLQRILQTRVSEWSGKPTVEQEEGRWGVRCSEGWIVLPLYDAIIGPQDGICVAQLLERWCIIEMQSGKIYPLGVATRVRFNSEGVVHFADHKGCEQQIIPQEVL